MIRKSIAGFLLLLFCCFQILQFHHHHTPASHTTHKCTSDQIHTKCDICDYVLKKQNSHLSPLQISIPDIVVQPFTELSFCYQSGWFPGCLILTDNKGPPASS